MFVFRSVLKWFFYHLLHFVIASFSLNLQNTESNV